MEKEYEAEYSESGTSYTLPYTFDYYKAGKNTFELSADTDEVIQFRSELYFDEDKRNATLPILSEDELKDKADSYAKKFIDIEEYQVSVENKTDYKAYKYTYTRYIDGYETSDRFAVALSDRGEIIFYSNSLMRNIKYVSLEGFDKEKAYEAVKEVLKEQYPDADPDTFEPNREILTLTEDNEVAFYYLATVVIFYGSGGEEIREAVPVRLIW